MGYERVDEVIGKWVALHKFTLYTELSGLERRFVYLSSDEGECCQIGIAAPDSGEIHIYAGGIETKNDVEMRMDWLVPVTELGRSLENALEAVQQWLAR